MHVSPRVLGGLAAAATVLVTPAVASAAPCGVFTADEGDNEIYYGLVARRVTLPCLLSPDELVTVIPEPTFRAAVCWRDAYDTWRYEEIGTCNTSTPAGNELQIFGAGGDDVIMPVTHRGRNDEFICPIPGTTGNLLDYPFATPPEFHSPPMYEWYERERSADPRFRGGCTDPHGCPYLPMGVSLHGGEGSDQLFGAPTADQLVSGDVFGAPWCTSHGAKRSGNSILDACVCGIDPTCCTDNWDWDCVNHAVDSCGADCSDLTLLAADGGLDLMCGQAEEDTLLGDEDSGPFAYEMMSGGPDLDFCRGVWPAELTGGNCCSATSTPGCPVNSAIESAVCSADPYCCSTAWDNLCVGQVESVAGGSCGQPGVAPCCEASSVPGCEEPSIEGPVCDADPWCCDNAWDSLCVGQVETVAGASCETQTDIGLANLCETLIEAHPAAAGAEENEIFERCGDNNPESLPPIPFGAHYPQDTGRYIISDSPGDLEFCDLPFPPPGG